MKSVCFYSPKLFLFLNKKECSRKNFIIFILRQFLFTKKLYNVVSKPTFYFTFLFLKYLDSFLVNFLREHFNFRHSFDGICLVNACFDPWTAFTNNLTKLTKRKLKTRKGKLLIAWAWLGTILNPLISFYWLTFIYTIE